MGIRRLGLIGTVFVLASAPLVALGYIAVSFSTKAVQDEAKKGAYDTAAVTAVYVDSRLPEKIESLDGYAHAQLAPALASGDPGDLQRATTAVVGLPLILDEFLGATFTDANGLVLASTVDRAQGRDFSYLEWYPPVVASGKPYMSAAAQDELGRWVVWIAVPIFSGDHLTGVLAAAFDLQTMHDEAVDYAQTLGVGLDHDRPARPGDGRHPGRGSDDAARSARAVVPSRPRRGR